MALREEVLDIPAFWEVSDVPLFGIKFDWLLPKDFLVGM